MWKILVRSFLIFLKYELSNCEKRLLMKALNFSLPPNYIDYADYLISLSCSIEIFLI